LQTKSNIIVGDPLIGLPLGGCWINEKRKQFWINIPKNASQFAIRTLRKKEDWWYTHEHGWMDKSMSEIVTHFSQEKGFTGVVILREPWERWKSATVHNWTRQSSDIMSLQNFVLYYKNQETLFEQDEHTNKQVSFLSGLDKSNAIFFNLDSPDFGKKWTKYLGLRPHKPTNAVSAQAQHAKDWLEYRKTDVWDKLRIFYREDVSLYNEVTYE